MTIRPINYEQFDPRWADMMYSNHGDKKQTIRESGCGPTCAAMVIATLRDRRVTPIEACAWAVANGHRTYDNGTNWAYFRPQLAVYGIACDNYITSADKAIAGIKQGYLVIALALPGLWTSSGHYILAYAVEGDKILINDPFSTATAREQAPVSTFKAECGKFWIVREAWREASMEIKQLEISNLDTGRDVTVQAVNIGGSNYVQLREMEKLFPVSIGNIGKKPTMKLNYK